LVIWSTVAGWKRRASSNAWPAYALIGFLTLMIGIGVAQYGSLQPNEPIHPVLWTLRTTSGIYVLLLWPLLIYASANK
jgi:hypothetical protein